MSTKLNLSWNYDKIKSDPLTSGKLFYRKPYVTDPIIVGTVNEVAPSFSVNHTWGESQGGNGLADVLSSIVGHVSNLNKSIDKFITGTKALATGSGVTNKLANTVNGDLNNMFKQYGGSEYSLTLPQLTILLLPSDSPVNDEIMDEETPAGKLVRLMSYQVGQSSATKYNYGDSYDSSQKVGPDESNTSSVKSDTVHEKKENALDKLTSYFNVLNKILSSNDKSIQTELQKLNDTKLIGSSAYFKNQIISIAPLDFVRSYNYQYPVYLQGTVSLVINGVIYKNLLISSIETECSKSRIINNGKDHGPSWIKITLGFVPAINWTVRDIEDIVLQLSNNSGYSLYGGANLY